MLSDPFMYGVNIHLAALVGLVPEIPPQRAIYDVEFFFITAPLTNRLTTEDLEGSAGMQYAQQYAFKYPAWRPMTGPELYKLDRFVAHAEASDDEGLYD